MHIRRTTDISLKWNDIRNVDITPELELYMNYLGDALDVQ
jgi:hypothetical protein